MDLLGEGYSLSAAGRMVGAAPSAVHRWREIARTEGPDGLKTKAIPGRPPRLSAKQKARFARLLLRGAQAHGYRTELWTLGRMAEVLKREFGVAYHRAHVSRLLADIGWSCQKPERRALERDEKAIEHWKRYKWVAIKKKPSD